MIFQVKQSKIVNKFKCINSECSNNCCQNWQMPVDEKIAQNYLKNPKLSSAIVNKEGQYMMRHDSYNACVKLESGKCGVYLEYGENLLGDACYFYPRIFRTLGNYKIMSASLSCPEISRILLENNKIYALEDVSISKIPIMSKDYLAAEINEESSLIIHNYFVEHILSNETKNSLSLLAEVITVSKSLDYIDKILWLDALPFLLETANARLIAEKKNINDPFNIINALLLLINASKINNKILNEVLEKIAKSLQINIDNKNLHIDYSANSVALYQDLIQNSSIEQSLKKYLYAQIASNLFPFAGLGKNIYQKISIISLKFVTIRLALVCHDIKDQIKVIHSISRLYDHLQSEELLISILHEFDWTNESRLLGLI